MKLLESKVALVNGAAQGIGRAIAEVFAENGACVGVADVLGEQANQTADAINRAGGSAFGLSLDVTDSASVQAAVDRLVDRLGRIDILVNNAGILRPHLIIDLPTQDWELVFKVNVLGTFLCSQAAARQMIHQAKGGSIINIASASGKKPDMKGAAYCASKSAIIGFTRVLALELGEYGIRANVILPGATDTEMLREVMAKIPGIEQELIAKTPLRKFAVPRDQANAALFLASELASHITGEQLVVSGGEFMET
jgi:NAD(P)-dependent dehydrogenase (short-subunit alcohol dehydrogenase family)